jgi:hypothetical protein
MQRLQPFGVDMPVAAFFVVSPMHFIWSVSATAFLISTHGALARQFVRFATTD